MRAAKQQDACLCVQVFFLLHRRIVVSYNSQVPYGHIKCGNAALSEHTCEIQCMRINLNLIDPITAPAPYDWPYILHYMVRVLVLFYCTLMNVMKSSS